MSEMHTAIHEAGHAVAHVRLRPHRGLGYATIVPNHENGTAGNSIHEDEWDCNAESMQGEVTVLCAGYGACVAAGMDETLAREGCDSDFEKAEQIIRGWSLSPLSEQLKLAIEMMQRPENRKAVQRLADELMKRQTVDGDEVGVIVEVSDGATTEEDYLRYRMMRQQCEQIRGAK